MDENTYKKIRVHAYNGEFSKVLNLINGYKCTQTAINVLIAVCKACCESPKECELDQIQALTTTLVKCISSPVEDNHLTLYFQCLYHIVKAILAEACFEDLSKMESVIIPFFLRDFSLKELQNAKKIYITIIKLISQEVGSLARSKNTNYNRSILEIIKIILKAQSRISNVRDLLSLAQLSVNQLHQLNIKSNDQLLTIYKFILELLGTTFGKIPEYSDTIQMLLMPIFASVFIEVQGSNFDFTSIFLDVICGCAKSNFRQNEYEHCHSMFRVVIALNPYAEHIEENIENAKICLSNFKSAHKKLFYNVIGFLEEPLLQVLRFCRTSGAWSRLGKSTIVNILNFLLDSVICNLVVSVKKCCCGCGITKNYTGCLKIGYQVASLLGECIDLPKNHCAEFFCHIGTWLHYFYQLIKKLRDSNCEKWSQYYSSLAIFTYHTSVVLYKADNVGHAGFDKMYLKNVMLLEGVNPEIRPVETVTFVFGALCKIEFDNEKWENCMGYAALHCLLFLQNGDSLFHRWWIGAKVKAKDNLYIQEQTSLSILYKQLKNLSHIVNVEDFLTNERKASLLSFELKRYREIWRSKVSMTSAFEHLIEIADIEILAQVIIEIFGDGDVVVNEGMSAAFCNATRKCESFLSKNPSSPKVKLALAVLYYYGFKDAFNEMRRKTRNEMEKTMKVLESAKKNENIEAVPKDANDECDVVSAYSALRISNLMEVFKSLSMCEKYIAESMSEHPFESSVVRLIMKLMTCIAFEYRLQKFSIRSLYAFEVAMKYSERISDHEGQLFALSFLIESADQKDNYTKELLHKGNELVKLLDEDNKNGRYNRTLCMYHICTAKAFLYEDPKKSHEAWRKADSLCSTQEGKKEFSFLCAELHVILYKLTKNCEFIQGEHAREPMTLKLHRAQDIILAGTQKHVLSTYDLCVMFDTVYEVTKTYYQMRLPRDLRANSKYSLMLSQNNFLPLRCVSFLLLLAHCDLRTGKFDHCSVKLSGVDDIFCLNHSRPPLLSTGCKYQKNDIEEDLGQCTSAIGELVLDVPQHYRQYSPASPTLRVEGFKFPQFLSHQRTCACFMCLCLEFQQLLLENYRLNALLRMHEKEDILAEEFIGGALAIHKQLQRSYDSYKAKASKLVRKCLVPSIEEAFLETYASILYDYSYHLSRNSKKEEALKANGRIIEKLRDQKMRYSYLYHDALLQRLSYIAPIPQEASRKMKITSDTNENVSLARTPTSKKSTIRVSVNGVSVFSPPRRKGKKCNLFKSPTHQDDVSGSSKQQRTKTKSRNLDEAFVVPTLKSIKTGIPVMPSTPVCGPLDTPKIHIFTDEPKTYSRKKTKANKQRNASVDTSSSENIAKSNVPVLDGKSGSRIPENRGHLLTQKIKESTGKAAHRRKQKLEIEILTDKLPVPSFSSKTDSDDNSVVSESPENKLSTAKRKLLLKKIKTSVKKVEKEAKVATQNNLEPKNLLSEFDASNEPSGSTGAIRRSARNRVLQR